MLDRVKLSVQAGRGGDGCVSFRREKFVPRGGPDGGDGGNGGSVYLKAVHGRTALGDFRRKRRFRATDGGNGRGRDQHGANGEDLVIEVPIGTVVYRLDQGPEPVPVADLSDEGESVCAARGGNGGSGNRAFATATNRIPLLAQKGEPGETFELLLEVKLVADVGLVGKPNAGKSTLLAVISRAHPETAPYAFTTIEPVLGVVDVGYDSFVAVEIPGLLEGAHEGVGLGLEFLRHIERTRLLVHLVDGTEDDPVAAVRQVRNEMEEYRPALMGKPFVIAVNKVDVTEVRERQDSFSKELSVLGVPVFFISAATGEGVEELVRAVYKQLGELHDELPRVEVESTGEVGGPRRRRARVVKEDGVFRVESVEAERLVGVADLEDWRARLQLQHELGRLGITRALERAGIRSGDTVILGDQEFLWE